VHFGLFGGTVLNLGTQRHRDKYADKIASLEVRGSFCLTELGHGSNARDIETVAHYDPKTREFVLHTPSEAAQKIWIGNVATHGNHSVVFAQLFVGGEHKGVHAFVVPIRDEKGGPLPGVRTRDCGTKAGLNGIDNGRLWLDRVRVPRENLLDRFAAVSAEGVYSSPIERSDVRFTSMITALVGGRIVVAQGALNISKVGLAVAVRYALSRRQFGPQGEAEFLLMDYLSHQRRLFPLLAKTYALQVCMNAAKRLYGEQDKTDPKELHVLAAGLKPACTWHRARTMQECREACGGMGFLAQNRIGPLKNDSDIDVTWEGDNTVLLQQVAAALLKEFRTQYQQGRGYGGLLEYLQKQMQLEIRDKNPIKRRWTAEQHLLDMQFYEDALEYREARLLRSLVNKLRRSPNANKPFLSWNESQDLALELAQAHVHRQVTAKFVAAIAEAPQSQQAMLHALCSLYALSCILDNMGWYLTFNYFTPAKSKAIWEEVNHVCGLIRPHARALVDSFGIPEGLIDAPIAGDWLRAFAYPNEPE
jgi:acyl-CoA oxidase